MTVAPTSSVVVWSGAFLGCLALACLLGLAAALGGGPGISPSSAESWSFTAK